MGSSRQKWHRYSKEYIGTATAVAWFDQEQWERIREVAPDRERLEESYSAWLAMAERGIQELEKTGMIIERVPVSAEDLIAWCSEQGRPIDSSARAEFAARELRRLHAQGPGIAEGHYKAEKSQMQRHTIDPNQRIEVRMSARDRELIVDHTFADPDYAKRLRAIPGESGYVGKYTLDDLEDLLGFIAAEANHCSDSKLEEELDELFARISTLQQSYDDGGWPDSPVDNHDRA
jgi:hypothetical protein